LTKGPLVSVVVPSYNQAQYLGDTLASIAAQDYQNVELIVMDGGSTDGSVELIADFARLHPGKVNWRSERDSGQADAINRGLAMARGEIIAWLNSDDAYLFAGVISQVVAAFADRPEAGVIYGDAAIISSDSRLLRIQCGHQFSYGHLLRGCFLIQPAVFMRRRVVEACPLDARLHYGLDYELWLRAARQFPFVYVPRLWAADRNYPERKILANRPALVAECELIMARYGQRPDAGLSALRMMDKIVYGLPGRLRGLAAMASLRGRRSDWAVPVRFEAPATALVKQLWTKNRDVR
jgi:glycosyltransferase involved in cell wall biosynthesis